MAMHMYMMELFSIYIIFALISNLAITVLYVNAIIFEDWKEWNWSCQDEKKSASSALSKYVLTLRQRAEQKNNSLMESRFDLRSHVQLYALLYRTGNHG